LITNFNNIYEIINKEEKFYIELKKNDYELLEKYILNNNYNCLKYALNILEIKNDYDFLKIFKPGFLRNENCLKRQLPCYLLIMSDKKTENVLLTYYKTRNVLLKYWNDTIII